MLGTIIILFAALFAVIGRYNLDPGIVGLSLTYATNSTSILNRIINITSQVETSMVSVERIKEYQDGLKNYNQLLEDGEKHPIEICGGRLRGLMPWIPKKNIKGAQAAYD